MLSVTNILRRTGYLVCGPGGVLAALLADTAARQRGHDGRGAEPHSEGVMLVPRVSARGAQFVDIGAGAGLGALVGELGCVRLRRDHFTVTQMDSFARLIGVRATQTMPISAVRQPQLRARVGLVGRAEAMPLLRRCGSGADTACATTLCCCFRQDCGVNLGYGSTADQGRTGREDPSSRPRIPVRASGTHAKPGPPSGLSAVGLRQPTNVSCRRGHTHHATVHAW